MISITLQFNNVAEARLALAALDTTFIAPADNPSVGAPEAPLPVIVPPTAAGVEYAGGVNPFAAAPGAASAPSTAAAAALPIAPAALATFALPPSASSVPVPPPVSAVPVPPASATPTSPAVAATLDSKGLPWDGRIHASTKSVKADGSWTQKRNVPEATVVAVEAELKGGQAARAPAALVPAAVPVPPAAPAAETFGTLMAYVAPLLSDPVAAPYVAAALAAFSEPGKPPVSLAGLAARATLWAAFKQYLVDTVPA